jgi:hypothetical protein
VSRRRGLTWGIGSDDGAAPAAWTLADADDQPSPSSHVPRSHRLKVRVDVNGTSAPIRSLFRATLCYPPSGAPRTAPALPASWGRSLEGQEQPPHTYASGTFIGGLRSLSAERGRQLRDFFLSLREAWPYPMMAFAIISTIVAFALLAETGR